jgi:hypothetical protein
MRSEFEREMVADLAKCDINASVIARVTRIPRSTIRGWLNQRGPRRQRRVSGLKVASLPGPEYSYLLGFYLGDGALSKHPRDVYRCASSKTSGRVNGKRCPRYFFSQVPDDIRRLFCETCEKIGVEYRLNRWDSVSIARAPSVAVLDSFIGPKA